jgi:hypothetical protein
VGGLRPGRRERPEPQALFQKPIFTSGKQIPDFRRAELSIRPLEKLSRVVQIVSSSKLPEHWKKRPKFSNQWKNIFQSLENWPFAGELPDCAKPRSLHHPHPRRTVPASGMHTFPVAGAVA